MSITYNSMPTENVYNSQKENFPTPQNNIHVFSIYCSTIVNRFNSYVEIAMNRSCLLKKNNLTTFPPTQLKSMKTEFQK